ncbi:MAG: hypothetical protein RDV41_10055, partial [Planctomycetota bacterium]|nr:hypothetical protein [Planctomycetota bacterium]
SSFDMKFSPAKGGFNFTTPHAFEYGSVGQSGAEMVIPLPVKGKSGVMAIEEKSALMVDCDGDGKTETKIPVGAKGGIATARIVYDDDTTSNYTMRIFKGDEKRGGGWMFQRSCTMAGKVSGATLSLVDDNNNGSYDDYGVDGIVIAPSTYAIPMGKVVSLGGKLYNFEAIESGMKTKVKLFEGETGTVDMASGFKCPAKLVVAVIQCGQNFFDVSAGPVVVPVGTYTFYWGIISNGKQSAWMQRGSMPEMEVKAGETAKVNWGMPLKFEFDNKMPGAGQLKVAPGDFKIFGAAGEEYMNFETKRIFPQVEVRGKNGNMVGKGATGEAC